MESNNDKLSYRPISDGDSSAWYYSGGIDEMTSTGCFILKFNHVNTDAGLPMSVCQENHYINAILIVTESGTGDNLQKNRFVGQTLILPQCYDGKTHLYTRTLKCADNLWLPWTKIQQNREVGQVTSLDTFIDSGVYIGTYTGASLCETFAMVVIENKSTASIIGNVRSVSQFKYSLDIDGTFSFKTRTGQGNESVTWGSWVDIGAADTKDIQDNSITALKLSTDVRAKLDRVTEVDEIKNNALHTESIHIAPGIDEVCIGGRSINGEEVIDIPIPAATTVSAGVMSADDKSNLNIIKEKVYKEGLELCGSGELNSAATTTINFKQYFPPGEYQVQAQLTGEITKYYLVIFSESKGNLGNFLVTLGNFTDPHTLIITEEDVTLISFRVSASNIVSEGEISCTISHEAYDITEDIAELKQTVLDGLEGKADKLIVQGLQDKISVSGTTLLDDVRSVTVGGSLYADTTVVSESGDYIIKVDNITANVSSFRLVGYKVAGGSVALLAHPQVIGDDVLFSIGEPMTKLRIIIEPKYIQTSGTINIKIKTPSYDIQEDLNAIKENVEKNTQDIDSLKSQTNVADIMFPVPNDIYCAVGTDMNLYYENMFGMLLGSGYMFIDSPNVVYDTSADDSGGYDKPLNLERQFHFKPNEVGTMELYLNVWNDYMQQVGAKSTLLHIVDPVAANGKTVNMLVNGSSSIDMGFMQAEIKLLLEAAGATVNMVGRWASGYMDDAREDVRYDVPNRLSENRSGGDSSLYTTKANSGKTVIVHPTNLVESFYQYDAVLQDDAGNTWNVWGNSADFCELVLKSGNISTIPASGTLVKISGKGPESFTYDRLITDVPQTTNPFWSDTLNGISFAEYCSNWNRPTPNVFVTLWGTNDIKGTNDNLGTGKQWANDEQIRAFVDRQKFLVDAYTRDCPNGVVIMCPQPTGSSLRGKKNSDKNGMLFSKLKVTQALMDAFAGYDNVIIVPVLWWFDRKYSYTAKDVTISERMADYYGDKHLDVVTDDSTHPQARGYYQMADAAYSAIVYWLDKKIA